MLDTPAQENHLDRRAWLLAPARGGIRSGVAQTRAACHCSIQSEVAGMMFACIHGPSGDLPQIAAAFSPSFEQTAPDTVVFRVDGLQRLHGSPRQIAEAIAQHAGDGVNIAIAETADAAIIAARNFPGVTMLMPPNLNDLDVSDAPAHRGDGTGIRKLGHLHAAINWPNCPKTASPNASARTASICSNWLAAPSIGRSKSFNRKPPMKIASSWIIPSACWNRCCF